MWDFEQTYYNFNQEWPYNRKEAYSFRYNAVAIGNIVVIHSYTLPSRSYVGKFLFDFTTDLQLRPPLLE